MARYINLGFALAGTWLVLNACGGRTAGLLGEGDFAAPDGAAFDFDASFGAVPGQASGGGANDGGRGNRGGSSSTGARPGRGSGGSRFIPGAGGSRAGSPNIGGSPGGMTGFGGSAAGFNCGVPQPDCFTGCVCDTGGNIPFCNDACFGPGSCAAPECFDCGDCFSDCLCRFQDPIFCEDSCFGFDAGSCGACPSIPASGPQITGCCLNERECGMETNFASILGVPEGCFPTELLFEEGVPDPDCDVGLPFPGCCRRDGTCGVDFGQAGLGCLPGPSGGQSRCGPSRPGSCCITSGSAGCNTPSIMDCVCEQDPFCCEQFWDESCVAQVDSLGCGTCSVQDAGAGCPAGQKQCGGICVAPAPGIGCSLGSCAACPPPPENASAFCMDGACRWECNEGFMPAGDLCLPSMQQ